MQKYKKELILLKKTEGNEEKILSLTDKIKKIENEEDLTDNELDFLDRWDAVRNQILNNGNSQLRKAIADLSKNNGDIKYNYKFYKNNREDEL